MQRVSVYVDNHRKKNQIDKVSGIRRPSDLYFTNDKKVCQPNKYNMQKGRPLLRH